MLASNEFVGELDKDPEITADRSSYEQRFINQPTRKFFLPFSNYSKDDPRRVAIIEKYGGIILGDIKFDKPNGDIYNGSILELPISYRLFESWWKEKTQNMTVFYFKDFVTSLFTDFLTRHVFSCAVYEQEPTTSELKPPEFSISIINTTMAAVREISVNGRREVSTDDYQLHVAPSTPSDLQDTNNASVETLSSFMLVNIHLNCTSLGYD